MGHARLHKALAVQRWRTFIVHSDHIVALLTRVLRNKAGQSTNHGFRIWNSITRQIANLERLNGARELRMVRRYEAHSSFV